MQTVTSAENGGIEKADFQVPILVLLVVPEKFQVSYVCLDASSWLPGYRSSDCHVRNLCHPDYLLLNPVRWGRSTMFLR